MKKKKRERKGWLISVVFAGMILCGVWLAVVQRRSAAEEPIPESPPHAGQVQVNDGTGDVWLRREENVDMSVIYRTDFFQNSQGWPVYIGNDYQAYRGVDVSELQGEIDWQQVKEAGIDFAFLRLGFRGYGESGRLAEDSLFAKNLAAAQKNGLQVGAYFFSQATSAREAEEEAEMALEILDGAALDLPVMFDWEKVEQEDSRTKAIPSAALDEYAAAFCGKIEESGYQAGIYFSRQLGYYGYDLSRVKEYTWWVADPGTYPAFYYAAAFWQYSTAAEVPGIGIIVDMDMWFAPRETVEKIR